MLEKFHLPYLTHSIWDMRINTYIIRGTKCSEYIWLRWFSMIQYWGRYNCHENWFVSSQRKAGRTLLVSLVLLCNIVLIWIYLLCYQKYSSRLFNRFLVWLTKDSPCFFYVNWRLPGIFENCWYFSHFWFPDLLQFLFSFMKAERYLNYILLCINIFIDF